MTRKVLVGAGLGAIAAAIAWSLGQLTLVRRLEDQTYDRRLVATARPAEARPDIVLVRIDESSLRALAPMFGRWPWPRLVHAGAIDFLARSQARVIAYDVGFWEADTRSGFPVGTRTVSGAESDAALVDSVRRAGNVVLLADATFQTRDGGTPDAEPPPSLPGVVFHPGAGFEARPSLRLPFPDLARAAAAIGHNFLVDDPSDGVVRRARPFVDVRGVTVPALGLAAALAMDHARPHDVQLEGGALRIGGWRMPLLSDPVPGDQPEPSKQVLLRFRGPTVGTSGAGHPTYPTYSFFNVLLSEDQMSRGEAPAIAPSTFLDKLVFVGTAAAGLGDGPFVTPFRGAGAAGIELHAALADDALSGRFMRRAPPAVDLAVTIAAGVGTGVLAVALPALWATAATLGVATLLVAGLTVEVGAGLWIASVDPAMAVALALFEGVAWQYFVEDREKRQVRALFGRYVSKDVFDHLVADPSQARLGGQRREMTVLFSDIRGFTTASERATPEAVVGQLNEYFTAMVEVLFRHQGTLDKFVGDMVMGLFGAPLPDPRHADHAVETALEMMAVLARLNQRWAAEGKPTVDIGIGVNSGEMIAGNIGSDTIMSYTVIGDAVNLGSRLESLNKEFGTHILISQATRDRLTANVSTRRIGDVTVKGRKEPVVVYEVTGSDPARREPGQTPSTIVSS